jgi:hypothetical protein
MGADQLRVNRLQVKIVGQESPTHTTPGILSARTFFAPFAPVLCALCGKGSDLDRNHSRILKPQSSQRKAQKTQRFQNQNTTQPTTPVFATRY